MTTLEQLKNNLLDYLNESLSNLSTLNNKTNEIELLKIILDYEIKKNR